MTNKQQLFKTLQRIRNNAEDWRDVEMSEDCVYKKGEGLKNIISQLSDLIIDLA